MRYSTAPTLDNTKPTSDENLKILYKIFNFQNKMKDLSEKIKEIKELQESVKHADEAMECINAAIKD